MNHRHSTKRMLVIAVAAVFAVVAGNLCILTSIRDRDVGNEPVGRAAGTPTDSDHLEGVASTSMFQSFDHRGRNPATSQSRAKALAAVFETGSPVAVTSLLAANGYGIGSVEKIGHSAAGPDKAIKVRNANGDMVAIPVRLTMTLPPRMNDPRMAPWSEAVFLFDEQGNLRHRLGGGLAADGVNGDMGALSSLGTDDGLFFWVTRFEAFHGFKMVSEVHALKPSVKPLLRVYHSLGDPLLPNTRGPLPVETVGIGFRGRQTSNYADGIGADGREHSNWLLWDADKQAFTGASRLRHGELPAFQVDLTQSEGFVPTDLER